MSALTEILTQNEKFKDYIKQIKLKNTPISILGLVDVAKSQWIAATIQSEIRPVCIITYNELQAKKLYEDLQYFNKNVVLFNKKEIVTYDYVAESKELLYKRIDILNKIYNKEADIIITTIEACMQEMISKKDLYKDIIKFEFNKEYKFEELKESHPVLKNIEYSIVTNGLLLTEERLRRLHQLKVAIAISIDGCDEKANQMRVDTAGNTVFNKIIKTLDLAKSIEIPVSLSITLTEESI